MTHIISTLLLKLRECKEIFPHWHNNPLMEMIYAIQNMLKLWYEEMTYGPTPHCGSSVVQVRLLVSGIEAQDVMAKLVQAHLDLSVVTLAELEPVLASLLVVVVVVVPWNSVVVHVGWTQQAAWHWGQHRLPWIKRTKILWQCKIMRNYCMQLACVEENQ